MTAIVIFAAYSQPSFAEFDLSIGGLARSYPLGGAVEANVGYGILLWGDSGPPWYGYLRPRIDVASAGLYNSISGSLEFYPVSFLGVRAGGESIQNDADYSAHDCVTYVCRGRFYNTFIQGELSLGAGPIFAQARYRRERWSQAVSGAQAFVDPETALALAGQGDAKTYYRGTLGMKLGEKWSLVGSFIYVEADSDRGTSRFPFALLRYKTGDLTIAGGGGVFSSPLKAESASALLIFSWEIFPSIALK